MSRRQPCVVEVNYDRGTTIQLIKSCGKKKDIKTLRTLLADKSWITDDVSIANTLINSYGKCGALKEARELFFQLTDRSIVSWNALIAGHADRGLGEDALFWFREMVNDGVTPNSVTYISILKACATTRALDTVEEIHARVKQQGLLNTNIVLGNSLVNAYVKCGALNEAQDVFNQLLERDVVTWSSLIAGYAEQGFGKEAITYFRMMKNERIAPNAGTYMCCLKACAIVGALNIVEEIHSQVKDQRLISKHIVLGTTLVYAYAKCGAVKKAREVFDQLEERDVVSWNAVISGYAEQGFGEEALTCFREMETDGVTPDPVSYACILKACAAQKTLDVVEEIFARVRDQGLLNKHIILANSLINAYAKCGALNEAQYIFDQITKRDVVSWSSLIDGYAEQGFGQEALKCFRKMQNDRVAPNAVTYVCGLKACAIVGVLEDVEEIHALVREQNLLNKDIVLGTTLVNAYAKCGAVKEAKEVFDQLVERNVEAWNAVIVGYAEHGFGEEALKCFREMESDGVTPDSVTYICCLKACAIVKSLDIVEEIHAKVRGKGFPNKQVVLGNSLVNAYAKCGALREAHEVFDQLAERDVISWSALIDGYTEQGFGEEALAFLNEMRSDGVIPNAVTYACSLKACAIVGALSIVEEIHAQVKEQGLLNKHLLLGTSLVNAYIKCGILQQASEVFDQLSERNIESWTAILAGYAQSGRTNEMFQSFKSMVIEGILPDLVTFLVLLNGCSHGALLEEGEMLFNMIRTYSFAPTPEHYTCMVDLFGRAGQFDKAKWYVLDHTPTLLTFLGACQKWLNVDLGRWAFDKLIHLDQKFPNAYVTMSNIYAAAGMLKEADEIEYLRVKNNNWKNAELCTDIKGNMDSFVLADKSQPQNAFLHANLVELGYKLMKYQILDFHWVSRAIPDHMKEKKLVIARALINMLEGEPKQCFHACKA